MPPERRAYECDQCNGQVIVDAGAKTPECCGQKMKVIPLDQCTQADTAEHARFENNNEPCDDGRSG